MVPLEQVLPRAERDRLRNQLLAEAPRWYSPYLHLGITTGAAFGVIGVAVSLLRNVMAWQWAIAAAALLVLNAVEWSIHRDVLHHRRWFAPVLFDRHTPQHHLVYVTDDMAIRSTREYRLVLIPAYGVALVLAGMMPLLAGLWLVGAHNLAALAAMVSVGYVASYEWLHLSYHLPADSWIGSRPVIRKLRRHHALHHDPRLMQRWNFNVTVPLWDWVLRTLRAEPPCSPVADGSLSAVHGDTPSHLGGR